MTSWRSIESAPRGKRILIWKQGGPLFATCDAEGQWRKLWGGPINEAPTLWCPLEPPAKETREAPPVVIDFEGQLCGGLSAKFAAEAEKRGMEPAALAADILEAVAAYDLFAAVLEDG